MAQKSSTRGFAGMAPEQRRKIASKGGRAAHQSGHAHEWNSEEAAAAGHLGGLAAHQHNRSGTQPAAGDEAGAKSPSKPRRASGAKARQGGDAPGVAVPSELERADASRKDPEQAIPSASTEPEIAREVDRADVEARSPLQRDVERNAYAGRSELDESDERADDERWVGSDPDEVTTRDTRRREMEMRPPPGD